MSIAKLKEMLQKAEFCFAVSNEKDLDGLQKKHFSRMPHIAMLGRSNVGKSSLINSLTGNKKLAKISKTPGRTRQINLFNVENRFILADLPGYGYAQVNSGMQEAWGVVIKRYLTEFNSVEHSFLIMDGRHPWQKKDLEMLEMLEYFEKKYSIILTKIDKLNVTDREKLIRIKNSNEIVKLFFLEKHHSKIKWFDGKICLINNEKKEGVNDIVGMILNNGSFLSSP